MRARSHVFLGLLGITLLMAVVVSAVVGLSTHRLYAVQTGSMSPAIPPKSLVVVEPGVYHIGQPITFMHNGSPITHRFIATNPDGSLVTKGDANRTVDASSVNPRDVVGGVIAAPQELGYWFVYFKSPVGFASLIVSILLIFQVWDLLGMRNDGLSVAPRHARPSRPHNAPLGTGVAVSKSPNPSG